LLKFLGLFADCFGRGAGRKLLHIYVKGQLSDLHRKTAEAIALRFGKAPRTLQRFLESIKWDEEKLRDRCQQIVAKDHAHPDAVIIVDEEGTAKSGQHTVGVKSQWCGNTQKVENCVGGKWTPKLGPRRRESNLEGSAADASSRPPKASDNPAIDEVVHGHRI